MDYWFFLSIHCNPIQLLSNPAIWHPYTWSFLLSCCQGSMFSIVLAKSTLGDLSLLKIIVPDIWKCWYGWFIDLRRTILLWEELVMKIMFLEEDWNTAEQSVDNGIYIKMVKYHNEFPHRVKLLDFRLAFYWFPDFVYDNIITSFDPYSLSDQLCVCWIICLW